MEIKEEHKIKCDSIAVCEEKSKKFVLNNAEDFFKVHIDGTVIPKGKEPKSCDYYLFKEQDMEIFIELKGGKVEDALSQIETSIKTFSQSYYRIYAFIIAKNCMPTQDTIIQRFLYKMKKKYENFEFKQKTNKLECNYIKQSKKLEYK